MKETIITLLILIYISGCIVTEMRQIAVENTMTLEQYKNHIRRKEFPRWVMVAMSWIGFNIINFCIVAAEIKTKTYFSTKRRNRMSKMY